MSYRGRIFSPGMTGRLRWALRMRRRPASAAGLLRLWWADFVLHPLFGIGERCQDCGRDYVLWDADDELYREVHGSERGTLCPGCFDGQGQKLRGSC
jgi:hypothetical protein